MSKRRSADRLRFLRVDLRTLFERRRFYRLFWVIAAVWIVYTFLLSDHSCIRWLVLRSDISSVRAEIVDTQAELDSLQKLAGDLRDDPATIERVAREEYNLIADGEKAYVFLSVDEADRERLLEEARRSREAHASPAPREAEKR